MRRGFAFKKRATMVFLTALILADIALGVYTWNLASGQSAQQELATLQRNAKLLKADIEYAQRTRRDIPAIQKQCDQYEHSMFPASSGYSSVTADLNALAAKSGVRLGASTFHSSEVKGHEQLKELNIDAGVTGSYSGVVHFLNALQRSANLYAVESLSARPEGQNQGPKGLLQVALHIKTYFRAS
jgi:Tfp pilus assembly protein PilO